METPKVYLSKSCGKFRVISQGIPLSPDRDTSQEALAALAQYKERGKPISISPHVWNGDIGEFEENALRV